MKKIFSLFIALTAVFSLSAKTIYLAQGELWNKDGARFAIHAFDNSQDPKIFEWYSMETVDGEDGIFKADVDDKYPQLVVCRMKGDAPENIWDNKWNQTKDLSILEDEDLFSIKSGEGDNYDGAWSKFAPAEPVHFFIAGTMTEWAKEAVELVAGNEDSLSAKIALKADSLYAFKVLRVQGNDSVWFGNAEDATMVYGNSTGWYLNGGKNVGLKTTKEAEYEFIFKNNNNHEISVVIPEPEYRLENGFYLIGTQFEWKLENVEAAQKFAENAEQAGEWVLKEVKLEVGDSIKVIKVESDEIKEWFGTDEGNYGIDEKHAGEKKDIYFSPERREDWKGHIWIDPNQGPQPELPYVALIGEMNNWDGSAANQLKPSEDAKTASATFNLTLNDNKGYNFKILVGEIGLSAHGDEGKYVIHRGWASAKLDWVAQDSEPLWLSMDVAGDYTFTFNFADSTLTITFPEIPEPVLANGFYLMGQIGGVESTWDYASLKPEHLFVKNEGAEGVEEYTLEVELVENDQLQVVRCDQDVIGAWYPGGENLNYMVDAEHAGQAIIYFRPNRDGGNDWWQGCIFVEANSTGVENTAASVKAVKTLENGMLIINKNGVRYNVMGQLLK